MTYRSEECVLDEAWTFHKTNIDIVKQIKDMGVNLVIDGGKSETIYEDDLLLDFFDKT